MPQLQSQPTISESVSGQYVTREGQRWYKIANSHRMPEFFLSLVSSGDHWMFLSSRGALTAGRQNPDSALFPYYSADKILDTAGVSGPKTLLRVRQDDGSAVLWEPFSPDRIRDGMRTQNLYKNSFGSRVLFEEVNHELQLAFRYSWSFGERFGFIRRCELSNLSDSDQSVEVIDGLENVLPSRIGKDFQLRFSNLGDAYKKSERLDGSSLGLFYLSSIPTDRAEPSEGLRANIVWQHGLEMPTTAVSSQQIEAVRSGAELATEDNVRGRRGAYFISASVKLAAGTDTDWHLVADVNCDHGDVIRMHETLKSGGDLASELDDDNQRNEERLLKIISAADGRQVGANPLRTQRHQSNVLFNVMRGGLPASGYEIAADDFCEQVQKANRGVWERHHNFLGTLPDRISVDDLQARIDATLDPDLIRITSEFLPLCFSRRHGDPTRPWNHFSIDLRAKDGSDNLSYQGNWRDIFQNWEALAVSYPKFAISMVFRFVNASTADGYNPYRITKNGFDWESPDPADPWANIGYWGDHQIIYLLKLLERGRSLTPLRMDECLSQQCCVYANIPYRIRSHQEICRDPQSTIDFDSTLEAEIAGQVKKVGGDGKLLASGDGEICRVSLVEKLLVPALVKLTNFVPGGGVWLNTQRPEWNDANNALVGRGLSVVTACYLRRYLTFLIDWFSSPGESLPQSAPISAAVWQLADRVRLVLSEHQDAFGSISGGVSGGDIIDDIGDSRRKVILDRLATAGADYRRRLYREGLSGGTTEVSLASLVELFAQAREMVDSTIRQNRRVDGMYHAYNLMEMEGDAASITHLYEMLEGQVAALSSGLLSGAEAVELLDSLRESRIYREDQLSYMLYPDRELPRFLEKNLLDPDDVRQSLLIPKLLFDGDTSVVHADVNGSVHFCGDFSNADDLNDALDQLETNQAYEKLVQHERQLLLAIFEATFGHRHFTGRSGTFFGYEGLGSIYWHMVSKLALAVMEHCIDERRLGERGDPAVLSRLLKHYREIRDGIGLTKTPLQYGAFPTDPYSHTPQGAGVQQPGMTGQVKEDVLSRWDELGIRVQEGLLRFDPIFFEDSEFLDQDSALEYFDLRGHRVSMAVPAGCFALTLCQVPIVYRRDNHAELTIHFTDREPVRRSGLYLSEAESKSLFDRRGEIVSIDVRFPSQADHA
ncbi:hypothetical protein [Neorhodopirellula lusitana]|uniref:hypothetical protein n=1 Tax=Neorhodopirellula lusitana TaxID=445327 RepID=UPI00384B679F